MVLPVLYFVFTEITNPLLNGRWFFENRPGWSSSPIYLVMAPALLVVFFFVRIVPIPYFFVHLFLPATYANATYFHLICSLTLVPLPFLLNMFWFSLMLKKAIRMITGQVKIGDLTSPTKEKKGAKEAKDKQT